MKRTSYQLPPARVLVLLAGLGVMIGGLFALLMQSLIAGAVVGLVFALAFAGILWITSKADPKKLKRRR